MRDRARRIREWFGLGLIAVGLVVFVAVELYAIGVWFDCAGGGEFCGVLFGWNIEETMWRGLGFFAACVFAGFFITPPEGGPSGDGQVANEAAEFMDDLL